MESTPETIGCVWTGNTLRVDEKMFESGKKKLRIKKYPKKTTTVASAILNLIEKFPHACRRNIWLKSVQIWQTD